MNYELGSLASTREEGAIVLSNDSRFPNATLYNGTNVVECRGSHDMKSEVRSGVSWMPNPFEIFREVNHAGEVINWGFVMLPDLTPKTEIAIDDLIKNMKVTRGGKRRTEVYREIGRKLPRINMKKNENGIMVIAPGVASLRVKDDNVQFREKSGGFDGPIEFPAVTKPQYFTFNLPLDTASFFPEEINNRNRYFINSKIKLLRGSQEVLKEKINGIIQNGSYTENNLRSLVNISFSLEESYEEGIFA